MGVMVPPMTIDHFDTPHSRLTALWILRIFSKKLARRFFIQDADYADAEIAGFLGLPYQPGPKDPEAIGLLMDDMLVQLESADDVDLEEPAAGNLKRFAETFGLSPAEATIIVFFVMDQTERLLCESLQVVLKLFAAMPERVLSIALKLPVAEVKIALRKDLRLMTSGVLRISASQRLGPHSLEFFSTEVAENLMHAPFDSHRILAAMGVANPEPPLLGLADYPHLEAELSMLIDYLRQVVKSGKGGVNILLHGAPGTGKTQLTRVIGSELALPIFDFVTEDEDGDPKSSRDRLASVRVAGSFLQGIPALFVFDEFEDILAGSDKESGLANQRKGWFNRMLETNARPVFWLSNSITHLDSAFCRRFDFIIEVPVPPRSQRAGILRKHAGKHLSGQVIDRLSGLEALAPAVVARVTEVFDVVSEKLPQDRRDETFARMVGAVLKAQGHSVPSLASDEILPADVYDTACLNTGADLPEIARMLRRHPHARICLHGPPGTGKTAFGHWLAREIDRPLHLTRAADLLSPFVGGTEMHIAGTFEKALRDDAILMIDEVDSFLQDRAKAVRSWEVTQVNELLTRMETFNGVFIATTNRLEHLDAASLRRFDLKLRFDYLAPHQIRELLGAWCRSLGIAPSGDNDREMIESMECVTPGDFAAAARRHRFQPFVDAGELLSALNNDAAMKAGSARRIGFL
jgi:transitional endoplasmic reticulum ATPase